MKNITGSLGILIILALIAVGVGMAAKNSIGKHVMSEENTSQKVSGGSRYTWSFQNLGEDESGAPTTAVTLRVDGAPYDVGTYQGSCVTMDGSSWEYQDNEISGVVCWFAGGGTEIGVFRENGTLSVKVGQLDEGSAETPSFRGNFNTLIQL